jgi:3-deoxy-7-phosphoheptulonate synthase
MDTVSKWTPSSWKGKPIKQQPTYDDVDELNNALEQIRSLPPLVHIAEVEALKAQLGRVGRGEKFLLQGGDCAERFQDCKPKAIEDKLKILLQMSLVLTYVGCVPVVRVARLAGQYAKPRSSPTEKVNGNDIPSFRGDNVNGYHPDDRRHDPQRLVNAYFHSAATLNYTRSVLSGGFANLRQPQLWNLDFVKDTALQQEYQTVVNNIFDSLQFFDTLESTSWVPESTLRGVNLYTSHEGLILDYEESLTRPAANYGITTSKYSYYNAGAHFLWIGDRTRQLDGAHVEYFSGIANPIGLKVGPTTDPDDLCELVKRLNPLKEPGHVTLISRCGADKVDDILPGLIEAVQHINYPVVWSCDPMHGNTQSTASGLKTRLFKNIHDEVEKTFALHEKMNSILGGVHLEMTGENVTECLGGSQNLAESELHLNYDTYCDPRLNYTQSLDLAFLISKRMRQKRHA